MFMTPYQHGVVREITERDHFDPANPQFQNYRYATHDLAELVDANVIHLVSKIGVYIQGTEWSKVK